ncbi:MAG TPA: TlpA disulfide reductase family protein [Chitinophagales bacterium]|nr:TlpA disulfide reductase family protein [Chitinophagales bacterium]
MKKPILALVLLLSVFLTNAQSEKTAIEKVIGEKTIPSITLADMNGKQVDVASYTKTGKITVLSFWATWCVPCKKELTNIADVYDEWKKKYNMQIIAVSIDDSRSATKVKPTVEGQRWEYEVLLDVNQDLKRQLNIQSVPFTLLVDATGKIVFSHSGYVDGDEYILEEEIQKLVKN